MTVAWRPVIAGARQQDIVTANSMSKAKEKDIDVDIVIGSQTAAWRSSHSGSTRGEAPEEKPVLDLSGSSSYSYSSYGASSPQQQRLARTAVNIVSTNTQIHKCKYANTEIHKYTKTNTRNTATAATVGARRRSSSWRDLLAAPCTTQRILTTPEQQRQIQKIQKI